MAVDPNVPADELPNVEQGIPLPGIAMVPVELPGAGLVPDDVISVAPKGIPVPPTAEPLVASSGVVVPIDGIGMTNPCATARCPARSIGMATNIIGNFTGALPSGSNVQVSN